MSWAKKIAEKQRAALSGLYFCNEFSSDVGQGNRPIHANLGGDASRRHTLYSVAYTGLSASELRDLFVQDMSRPEPEPFRHARLEPPYAEDFDSSLPFYATNEDLSMYFGESTREFGPQPDASYTYIARDEKANIVGFCVFKLAVQPSADYTPDKSIMAMSDAACQEYLNTQHAEARTLELKIHVQEIYVVKAARGKGVGTALLSAIARVYRSELQHFGKLLESAYQELDEFPFIVRTELIADLASLSGKVAYDKLFAELRNVQMDFDLEDPQCEQEVLEVLAIQESIGY